MTFRQTISAAIASVLLLPGCGRGVQYPDDVRTALKELDEVIAQKEMIEAQKEDRITQIKGKLADASDDRQRYELLDELVDEYFQYNIDSTAFLSRLKLSIAERTGNNDLINDARYDIADRHTMSGLADATFNELKLIDIEGLYEGSKLRYYSILNTIYRTLEVEAVDETLAQEYARQKTRYRELLLSALGEDDISRIYVMTEILLQSDRPQEALDLLIPWVEEKKPSLNESGILCYSIASAYAMLEDVDKAILWYARSAKSDLLVPKYEYRSLYELAGLLNRRGDIERAYSYITRSIEDAVQSNAQIHKQFAYQLLPIISNSYDSLMRQKNTQMKYTLIAMGIVLGLLIIMSLVLLREKKKVTLAERQTKDSNEQLRKLNAELHDYVILLQETNEIKDSYLGRYLNMCSDYIDGLDRYRSSLRKTGKEGGDVMAALKSKAFMEAELEEFYTQFDATFLDLFPDFIPQVNELLQEDKRISYKPKERLLSTELRVLALIRLGVNDSARIAQFLRRSVSTIYNYRVKMRNAANVDREEFENRLMKIGKRL
jgi:DNA-binding CsgD family transcriptional regulator